LRRHPTPTLFPYTTLFRSKASTDAYFDEVAQKLGKSEKINGLGQGAYTTSDKSAVVRKDYKVLLVDISKLPAQFGSPPDSRENIDRKSTRLNSSHDQISYA